MVTIASFARQLDVITSKQRPRKLTIHGSDGDDYAFLLKGHEDLRQDERVMQVFSVFFSVVLLYFTDLQVDDCMVHVLVFGTICCTYCLKHNLNLLYFASFRLLRANNYPLMVKFSISFLA